MLTKYSDYSLFWFHGKLSILVQLLYTKQRISKLKCDRFTETIYTRSKKWISLRRLNNFDKYGISESLIWSQSLMELILNPCGEFWWSPESPVSQIHSPHLHVGAPGIFSHLLRSVKILKRESGIRKATGSYCTYSKLGKTATLVPGFAVEDLPLARTATLVPAFAVKHLALDRTLWW